jgi:phosphohistidine phosphatase SixA
MNKRLILVRHANANKSITPGADYTRTLSQIGIEEAQEMAFRAKNKKFIAKIIVSSPAIRAISTLVFLRVFGVLIYKISLRRIQFTNQALNRSCKL